MVFRTENTIRTLLWLGCWAIMAASKKLFCRHCGAEITDHNYHVHLESQPNAQVFLLFFIQWLRKHILVILSWWRARVQLLSSLAQNCCNFRMPKGSHLRFGLHVELISCIQRHNDRVQVATFTTAVNVSVQKHAHTQASLFPPYTWQVATCGRCHSALGWLMQHPTQDAVAESGKPGL